MGAPPKALLAALLLALALVGGGLLLTACGGNDDGVSDEDRQAIEAVIDQVQAIAVTKDAGAFCDLLQPSSFDRVFPSRARCEKEFDRVLETSPGPPRNVGIREIEVDGERAKVTFETDSAPTVLVKEDGDWYLPLPDPDSTVTDGA